ncbi:SigB/SigF/SigG family RNA polymerase sigma factor [Cryptosporangium japonicum]|uniref:RNA polymerase sigma-B factor n=1 Tax=Cryptosporangium japonicum TaxID=80872 RepID=A0ABN0TI55_9ACTN
MTLAPIAPGRADYSDYPSVAPLFQDYSACPDDAPERAELRERLALLHLPLAENLARRFARRGEPVDDLVQVARLGLLKAIDRFDPRREVPFLGFAVPTIVGEIRRHFRDRAWCVRPPRRLQDLHLRINAATTELLRRDHHAPTAQTLARHLGVSTEEILEAIQLTNAYAPMPLDASVRSEPNGPSLIESLGEDDQALGLVDDREALKRLVRELPDRERRILALRFFEDRTQTQIAADVGVSQMQVSRLLSAILAHLRRGLLND